MGPPLASTQSPLFPVSTFQELPSPHRASTVSTRLVRTCGPLSKLAKKNIPSLISVSTEIAFVKEISSAAGSHAIDAGIE
jgi:hypothetical protein